AERTEPARLELSPDSYGAESARRLLDGNFVPPELRSRFARVADAIVEACRAVWPESLPIRLHGDCHLGNLLFAPDREHPSGRLFFVVSDDFLSGPPVQDLWLLAPGRDAEAQRQRALIAEAYATMRSFDHASLRLVEPLRALRILRYAA